MAILEKGKLGTRNVFLRRKTIREIAKKLESNVFLRRKTIVEIARKLEGFQSVCKKILQAYRIRLKLLIRRYRLLDSIGNDYHNTSPDFYTQLKNILSREKRVLKIIEGEEKKVGNNLKYAREQLLNAYMKSKVIHLLGAVKILDVKQFLKRMIYFVHYMEKDIHKIEKRIEIEEKLADRMSEHYNDQAQFNKFISAWNKELKANDKMMKHFKKALRESEKVIKEEGSINEAKIVGTLLAGKLTAVAGATAGGPVSAAVGVALGLVIIVVGFMKSFDSVSHEALLDVKKEKELIKEIEKRRPSFWSRFG